MPAVPAPRMWCRPALQRPPPECFEAHTALRLAAWFGIEGLLAEMALLRQAFEAKADAFKSVLKIGRTQLQDAVPMTLGQEFLAFAIIIGYEKAALIAKTALASGGTIADTAQALGIMSREDMQALLVPERLSQPVRLVR